MSNIKKTLSRLILFREPENKEEFIIRESVSEADNSGEPKKKEKKLRGNAVSDDIKYNLERIKQIYSVPENADLVIREFDITIKSKAYEAFIAFFDGLADREIINDNILQPLMLLSNLDIKDVKTDIEKTVSKHLLPHNQIKISTEFSDIVSDVNFGSCAIFINSVDKAFIADVKGWEHRGIERPNMELVIKGPQEGFNELLRTNTALLRKILKDENLIVEDVTIGERSKTPCSIIYIKNIANKSLVGEVRKRLKSIKMDYLIDSGQLKQLIEDTTYFPIPQVLDTERPDKAASMISEGRVAVIVNGSPYVLIVPVNVTCFFHSPEDSYIKYPFANFLRLLRVLALIITLLLPGLYIAIINYHHEMIPTDLLLAIEASREKVPFPSILELFIMEISFELIREAGIRIPGPIGPTLGIVGALILGEAAVAANIISPILIIVVAVTGISSFAIPDFSFAFSLRILRFAYIILGSMAGFLGVTFGAFIHFLLLADLKSFGVPFLSPFAPLTKGTLSDEITRAPIWKQENRPDYLNTKDKYKQPEISREWKKK